MQRHESRTRRARMGYTVKDEAGCLAQGAKGGSTDDGAAVLGPVVLHADAKHLL